VEPPITSSQAYHNPAPSQRQVLERPNFEPGCTVWSTNRSSGYCLCSLRPETGPGASPSGKRTGVGTCPLSSGGSTLIAQNIIRILELHYFGTYWAVGHLLTAVWDLWRVAVQQFCEIWHSEITSVVNCGGQIKAILILWLITQTILILWLTTQTFLILWLNTQTVLIMWLITQTVLILWLITKN
jgi:hypothetical protein